MQRGSAVGPSTIRTTRARAIWGYATVTAQTATQGLLLIVEAVAYIGGGSKWSVSRRLICRGALPEGPRTAHFVSRSETGPRRGTYATASGEGCSAVVRLLARALQVGRQRHRVGSDADLAREPSNSRSSALVKSSPGARRARSSRPTSCPWNASASTSGSPPPRPCVAELRRAARSRRGAASVRRPTPRPARAESARARPRQAAWASCVTTAYGSSRRP